MPFPPPPLAFERPRHPRCLGLAALSALLAATAAHAHNLTGDPFRPHYDRTVTPPSSVAPAMRTAATRLAAVTLPAPPATTSRPSQAAAFAHFAPQVTLRWDHTFLYIESHGLPAHPMMTGITNWQQQVPLPQPYTGNNAWRLPLHPAPSPAPVSIRGRFLRGAIAIAVNGVPIFNPQNNRGELAQEIGELDRWGGHCGRADDYHYHAAPLHLQDVVGHALPIAFALDGYPLFGLTEPDGSKPSRLDAFNGHSTPTLGYHYHASTRYPYVNGGFHGVVVERDGQVDPQPRAQPIRPALSPLRNAVITHFEANPAHSSFTLRYTANGRPATIAYAAAESGAWLFRFTAPDGATRDETYRPITRGRAETRAPR